jgi:hypothetical protein
MTIERLKSWILLRGSLVAVCVSALFSLTATTYFYAHHDTLLYEDSRSHLDIARRVFDNKTPSILQLGYTWLPLPQVLMLPFITNNFLWHSGLAGSIVSMAAYILSAFFIYRTIHVLTGEFLPSFLGMLVFDLNVNILYLQSTPMTELILICTLLGGVYFLLTWFKTKQLSQLILSAFFLMLSTLARYDGWFLLVVSILLIAIQQYESTRNIQKTEGSLILFSTLGTLGILLWLAWNGIFWGHPLNFLNGQYSAQHQQDQLQAAGALPTKHHLVASLHTMVQALYLNSGIPLFIVSLLALAFIMTKMRGNKLVRYALILLFSPAAFNALSLFLGISTIRTSWHDMFNIRYGVLVLPFFAVIAGLALFYWPRKSRLWACAVVLCVILVPHTIVTLYDPMYGSSGSRVTANNTEAAFLSTYTGGNILASTISFDSSMQDLAIPLKNYIQEGNGALWTNSLKDPAQNVQWIMMRKDAQNDPVYAAYLVHEAAYNQSFVPFFQEGDTILLKRRV